MPDTLTPCKAPPLSRGGAPPRQGSRNPVLPGIIPGRNGRLHPFKEPPKTALVGRRSVLGRSGVGDAPPFLHFTANICLQSRAESYKVAMISLERRG